MIDARPLRVCLDARLRDGASGGVQQTIIGLAAGLSSLEGGNEEYLFLCDELAPGWLLPYLGNRCRILQATPAAPLLWKRALRRVLPSRVLEAVYRAVVSATRSDGTIEAAGVDVMHFTLQSGFLTSVPNIYLPHDLQHVHLPECFARTELAWRDAVYPALCRQASTVVALTEWGRRDLETSYGIAREKIRVIPWAPAIDVYPVPSTQEMKTVRTRLRLPPEFLFYPAATFPHKNHLKLLEAVASLRERDGLRIQLVFSGHQTEFFEAIRHRLRELALETQTLFLGYVAPLELQCVYRLSLGVVFPSLFEGFGMPVLEAFRLGVPVACSSAASLPELAGGAASMFEPTRTEAVAAAIRTLWTDSHLRAVLSSRGRDRARQFSWTETAEQYRALYRQVAGGPLSKRDWDLLALSEPASVTLDR